jgi:hypothetical protein
MIYKYIVLKYMQTHAPHTFEGTIIQDSWLEIIILSNGKYGYFIKITNISG